MTGIFINEEIRTKTCTDGRPERRWSSTSQGDRPQKKAIAP